MTLLAWALPGLPLAGGALLLAAHAVPGRRADRAAPPLAVVVAVAVLGLAIASAVLRPAVSLPFLEGIPIGMAVDGLSAGWW